MGAGGDLRSAGGSYGLFAVLVASLDTGWLGLLPLHRLVSLGCRSVPKVQE